MGKVVATLAAVALAVAISFAAPYLSAAVLAATATTATTAAVTAGFAAALSFAGGLLLQQIGSNPPSTTDDRRCPSWTPTEERRPVRVQENWKWRDVARPKPKAVPIGPVQISLARSPLRALIIWATTWIYGSRFWIVRTAGVCMEPMIPKGHWVLIDNAKTAQPGNAISFMTDDLFENWVDDYSPLARFRATGMIKQYLGLADDGKVIVFRSMNEPVTGHAGIARLQYLHVVRSSHASWFGAVRALLRAAFRD